MRIRGLAACVLLGMLAGCGGGGGRGGSSQPQGLFTLSASSLSFSASANGATPASQSVTLTITSPGAAYAGAAYPKGTNPPAWLAFAITGSGSTYTLTLSIATTSLVPGQYTTTFEVGTADGSGNVLQSQNFTVTYTVNGSVAVSGGPYMGTFVYGSNATSAVVPVKVTAVGVQWKATSDSAWLIVPTGAQSGSASLPATVDVSSLAPGSYQGTVTVTDTANASDTGTFAFSVTVTAPTLMVTQGSLLLGGTDGLSTATPQPLNFAVSTGTAAHPFAVTFTTTSGGNWLSANLTSGTVASAGAAIQVSGNRTGMVGGTYTGQVKLAVTVGTLVLTQSVPVTFNVEANRIVVGASGVGFLSASSGSVLTRTVTAFSPTGSTTTPWQAASDQSWLTVTPSGVTGGAITLTAVPTGLPTDTTQFATVTVTSTDPTVENQETIRVGLYVASVAPVTISQPVEETFVATSPVEPIAFVSDSGTSVTGYNVYTGAVDRTFANVAAAAAQLVVSADGTRLFVYDSTNLAVIELDATTGAIEHSYPSSGASGSAIGYVRPNGFSVLITPQGFAYDVTTHAQYADATPGAFAVAYSFAGSPDNSKLVTDSGNVYSLFRTALGGGSLQSSLLFNTNTVQGAPGQACISADGQTVYTASGSPYNFYGNSTATHLGTQVLPGQAYPNAIACVWNGVVVGGTLGEYDPTDVFVYNGPTGVQLAVLNSSQITNGYREMLARGMGVSADSTRLITVDRADSGTPGSELRFQPLPGPP